MVFFDSFLYNGYMDKKKLLLIDGSSVAFRAFFALYQQLDRFKNAAGLHTNAIYGFQLMLSHLLERVEPSHILVAFDAGKTTFRTEMYADYKGGRAKTPDEFREQFPFIRELLDHMGIRHYELAQYEADDIIGTLDKLAEQDGFDITIVSGDKDLIQLTDEHTVVEISKKGVKSNTGNGSCCVRSNPFQAGNSFIGIWKLATKVSHNLLGCSLHIANSRIIAQALPSFQ
ncbi:DNA polymerase I - 3'-5' exonuclease and polymerase domains [Streptococcus pneumoniae]|nr:DNA polymerase I - 3'-5' exonuclease and polymerase domains [Streptococcus pneumoniae]